MTDDIERLAEPAHVRLLATIGATWTYVSELQACLPVLARFASADEVPDDQVIRRFAQHRDGSLMQIPVGYQPGDYVGRA